MRYHTLDAWRGVACLLVIVFHSVTIDATAHQGTLAYWLLGIAHRGWIGVPMFFVISGYCITAAAQSAIRNKSPLGTYFVRRFRRIFPPYLICLAGTAAIVGAADLAWPGFIVGEHGYLRPWWFSVSQWIGNATLTEGWRHHIAGSPKAWFMGHAWTLGYEEQFYAVTGLLLLAGSRFFIGVALVSLAVLTCCAFSFRPDGAFFNGLWMHFVSGVLVYYAINRTSGWKTALAIMPLMIGLAWAVYRPADILDRRNTDQTGAMVAFGFALLLLALHRFDGPLSRSRLIAPLTFCGVMCYSLYLTHLLACHVVQEILLRSGVESAAAQLAVTVPLCLAASIVAGYGFHVLVERRFLNTPVK